MPTRTQRFSCESFWWMAKVIQMESAVNTEFRNNNWVPIELRFPEAV